MTRRKDVLRASAGRTTARRSDNAEQLCLFLKISIRKLLVGQGSWTQNPRKLVSNGQNGVEIRAEHAAQGPEFHACVAASMERILIVRVPA